MTPPSTSLRVLLATAVILSAVVGAVVWQYWDYVVNPWTRNGQVRAQVIQITPRVSGTIVKLPIVDNRFVKAGDLLFEIDPRTYESTLDGMRALLDKTRDEIEALKHQVESSAAAVRKADAAILRARQKVKGKQARLVDYQNQLKRYSRLVKTGAASKERLDRAVADVADADAVVQGALAELLNAEAAKLEAESDLAKDQANLGAEGQANARLRAAKARVHSAALQLEFTRVVAPVDGYVTNLNLRLGDHATANKAVLALVDVDSYWVHAFFRENAMGNLQAGDRAVITLVTYPDKPVEGRVESLAWGIWQKDGTIKEQLLPYIAPSFEWIRLAERVPVRIKLDKLPEGVNLRVGTTASVVVLTGTAGKKSDRPVPPVPAILH